MSARSIGLSALLLGSGAAALMYEVCWSRELALHAGFGGRGAALTLTAFFAGAVLGYAFGSAWAPRLSRPLLGYAACELFVSGFALALPELAARLSPSGGWTFWAALLPPSAALAASLPFALEAASLHRDNLARAYAFNLFGAVLGCFVATFVAIAALGVWASTYAAAALSAACGTFSLLAAERREQGPKAPASAPPEPRFWLQAALAGAATLALEVLSLRLFALTFHNSTYTFGLTLAVFLLCLGLGSRTAARDSEAGASVAERALYAALFVLLMAPAFAALTRYGMLRAPGFAGYLLFAAGLVLVILALPVSAAGSLLPALWASARGRAGRTVGALAAANSAGASAGALLATFVLLPRAGLLTSLVIVSGMYAALGIWLGGLGKRTLLMLLALLPLGWLALSSGPPAPEGFALKARWESAFGLLDLVESREDHSLSARLDLHYQLGSSADRERHVLMGSLPLALHGKPRRVLFIGLATGMTASAILSAPSVERAEIVELIPEMAELARRFAAHNGRLLDDPRVRLVIDDGRAHLRREEAAFDVIVSDLFVPWHSHAGYLYTVEHYRAARARLARGGVFAQWLPLYQLGARELELIANSFSTAFPEAHAWIDDRDPERALLALVSSRERPTRAGSSGGARLLGLFRRTPGAALNSDEHPLVEFSAPRTERARELLTGEKLRAYLADRFGAGAAAGRAPELGSFRDRR